MSRFLSADESGAKDSAVSGEGTEREVEQDEILSAELMRGAVVLVGVELPSLPATPELQVT